MPSGPSHWTCEALGCAADLSDAQAVRTALLEAAEVAKATVVGEASHVYHGGAGGLTMVLLCAESHLLISTWPEAGYALVEVFLCGSKSDPEAAAAMVREALGPTTWRTHTADVSAPSYEG